MQIRSRSQGPGPTARTRVLTAIVALPAMVVIGLALAAALAGERSRFPCPLYPNASVGLGSALLSSCTLTYGERIRAIETREGLRVVESAGELKAFMKASRGDDWRVRLAPDASGSRVVRPPHDGAFDALPSLLASLVLWAWFVAIARLTAIRAPVAAAWPFAIVYGAVATLVAAALVGWWSAGSYPVASMARAMLAAALIDLALVFPRERPVGSAPRILPYLVCGLLCAAELHAAYLDRPTTMLLIQKLLVAALAVACLLMAIACAMASRTSPSSLERRQAQVCLQGLLGLAAVTGVFALFDASGGLGSAATVGAALSPLPLGVAIARHHLFDLDRQVRRGVAHLVSAVVLASLLFVPLFALREVFALPAALQPAPLLFAAVFCAVLPLDLLRRGVASWVEGALRPRGASWEELVGTDDVPGFADARDAEAVARALGGLLGRGFPEAHHAVHLTWGDAWILAHASGPGPWLAPDVAKRASSCLPWRPTDLNRLALDETGERLMAEGLEASAPILWGERLYGWILIHPRRPGHFLSTGHLGFLSSAASQAAGALHHLELQETLLANERFAAQGRLHAELAHELGKPLGTLEVHAHRLRSQMSTDTEPGKTVAAMARLATRMRKILRGVLAETRTADASETVRAEELLAQAGRDVSDVRGDGWIVSHPPVHPIRLPASCRSLVRVLTNLLHNAIDASQPGQTVHLRVRDLHEAVEFEVADAGPGISTEVLGRVMHPFVTTRPEGTGLGLVIAQQIVESLGGRLELDSQPGRGTRARVRLAAGRACPQGGVGR